jgi:uncharacterized protein YbjT (DUF2867 family)
MKTALIAGSTGLIGTSLLSMLLPSPRYQKIIALTRRELPAHPKLVQIKTDLSSLKTLGQNLSADEVFCALGTTMAKAGSKEKFYEADFEYPYELARITRQNGATQFLIVTALGANKTSRFFYNRVKGEVEDAITRLDFPSLHIFRPSLLLGNRSERRMGEDFSKIFFKAFGFLVPRKYKAIQANDVATAMVTAAEREEKGIFFYPSEEIQKLAAIKHHKK